MCGSCQTYGGSGIVLIWCSEEVEGANGESSDGRQDNLDTPLGH